MASKEQIRQIIADSLDELGDRQGHMTTDDIVRFLSDELYSRLQDDYEPELDEISFDDLVDLDEVDSLDDE